MQACGLWRQRQDQSHLTLPSLSMVLFSDLPVTPSQPWSEEKFLEWKSIEKNNSHILNCIYCWEDYVNLCSHSIFPEDYPYCVQPSRSHIDSVGPQISSCCLPVSPSLIHDGPKNNTSILSQYKWWKEGTRHFCTAKHGHAPEIGECRVYKYLQKEEWKTPLFPL